MYRSEETQLIKSENLCINLSFLLDNPTGISTYALNILPYLKDLKPNLLTHQSFAGYTCHPIPKDLTAKQGIRGHINRIFWMQFKVQQICTKIKANLFFSPLPEAPLNSRHKTIITVHDLIPLRFPRLSPALTYYYRYYVPLVLNQASHILCNSVTTANEVMHRFGISANKITPTPLACNTQHFIPLNLPSKNYFLYFGRHSPYKNIHRLITAFSKLPKSSDVELWVAGPYDYRYTRALQHYVQDLDLESSIKFLDYVSYKQLPILINEAIAVIFPSLWEGFGLPVIESMACGTPVIASNIAAFPETVGDAAILVNPLNIDEIFDAIKIVMNEEQTRSVLRAQGLLRVKKFSWEKTGRATNEILSRYM
ncbi:glycosyltransferase family 1 protein [Nodosilinea sp. E11]|uniref:glycosyltransferase family 4 protein n=1 Tax=Nodosilinea sp. E11 TaxID=3037479 RepID=UPI002934CEFD|nr:glycosyltransferase family 1 protein [Nodosilinea sp. E11]WOD36911.1 glycosyltransferase family 1 protein [Nodosilinea sp. E11]